MDALYTDVRKRLTEGGRVVVKTVYPAESGELIHAARVILPDGDADAARAIQAGIPLWEQTEVGRALIEPFFPDERLIVLGAGHIALSLVEFAAKTGFSVVVCDDRPSFANVARFPLAAQVVCEDFVKVLDTLKPTERDYVVIITRGHRHDRVCLEQLAKFDEPYYTGMIGSRRRTAALKSEIIENGADAMRIGRIHTPIGLNIGGVTPPEIAVSILAELIQRKRQGYDKTSTRNRTEADMPIIAALATDDEPKAVVTVVSAKGSVPRGPGAKMLVYTDGRVQGSIGGGCSEAAVLGIARGMIGTGAYTTHHIDMTAEIAEEEGMVCGGVMTVLIEDAQIT